MTRLAAAEAREAALQGAYEALLGTHQPDPRRRSEDAGDGAGRGQGSGHCRVSAGS